VKALIASLIILNSQFCLAMICKENQKTQEQVLQRIVLKDSFRIEESMPTVYHAENQRTRDVFEYRLLAKCTAKQFQIILEMHANVQIADGDPKVEVIEQAVIPSGSSYKGRLSIAAFMVPSTDNEPHEVKLAIGRGDNLRVASKRTGRDGKKRKYRKMPQDFEFGEVEYAVFHSPEHLEFRAGGETRNYKLDKFEKWTEARIEADDISGVPYSEIKKSLVGHYIGSNGPVFFTELGAAYRKIPGGNFVATDVDVNLLPYQHTLYDVCEAHLKK